MCLLLPISSQASDLDPAALIERLKKPAPASIEFKEFRFSALLEQPLVVSGELNYLAADHLERFVKEPYREKTIIRGESVRVERDGEKLRTFALKRAPELRGLLTAFGALLTGNSEAVRKQFEITATGEAARWELKLIPLDARSKERIQEITITGAGDTPSCLFMGSGVNTQSVMLFGEHPNLTFNGEVSPERLSTICNEDSAAQ
jgi:hypothetical protein